MCLIFGHSPPASQHTWSICPQACGCPLEKSFMASPLTNFAPPPLPLCHLQTYDPANVLSQVQTSESPMAPSADCMVDVSTPQISEHVVYPPYAQPHGGGRCREATVLFLREVPGVSIVSRTSISFTGLSLYRALVTI